MFKNIYQNIGKKIKGLARVLFIIEAIVYALAVFAGTIITIVNLVIYETNPLLIITYVLVGLLVGFGLAVASVFLAWISTWLLYAFGELVDKVCSLENTFCTEEKPKEPVKINRPVKAPAKPEAPKTIAQEKVSMANKG